MGQGASFFKFFFSTFYNIVFQIVNTYVPHEQITSSVFIIYFVYFLCLRLHQWSRITFEKLNDGKIRLIGYVVDIQIKKGNLKPFKYGV